MQRSIQFYEHGLTGKTVLEYSDERLIEVVSEIINKVGGTYIYLSFYDRTDRYGGMMLTVSNAENMTLTNQKTITLHDIDLHNECYKDCVRECQREKALLQKHFKQVKVKSNFR